MGVRPKKSRIIHNPLVNIGDKRCALKPTGGKNHAFTGKYEHLQKSKMSALLEIAALTCANAVTPQYSHGARPRKNPRVGSPYVRVDHPRPRHHLRSWGHEWRIMERHQPVAGFFLCRLSLRRSSPARYPKRRQREGLWRKRRWPDR